MQTEYQDTIREYQEYHQLLQTHPRNRYIHSRNSSNSYTLQTHPIERTQEPSATNPPYIERTEETIGYKPTLQRISYHQLPVVRILALSHELAMTQLI